jgi:hypothetical protein
MNLGNLGDTSNLVWLYCDMQIQGQTLVHKGWKQELPTDRPPIWVFCPLRNVPAINRDRVLVEECEKCPHYKGADRGLTSADMMRMQTKEGPAVAPLVPPEKRAPKIGFSKIQLGEATEEFLKEEREWQEEERHRGAD